MAASFDKGLSEPGNESPSRTEAARKYAMQVIADRRA
jgi:hypothetical protein